MSVTTKKDETKYVTLKNIGPTKFYINGFSINETILDILKSYEKERFLDDMDINELADEIEKALAKKLNLIQGYL